MTGTAPFPDGSPVPIITAVIVIVVIILVIGVVVYVVTLMKTWRKKQQSQIEMENEIELKLRQAENCQLDNPHYQATPPTRFALSNKGMESNPVYWNIDHLHEPTNVPQKKISDDIYTLPDTTGSQTVEVDHGTLEVVYSEPIKPSLFADVVESPKSLEDMQPYAPIYAVPVAPRQSDEMLLEVSTSNIQEICELGTGLFGQVVLAETVGLSPKDLKLSESDDNKSKSTFVAVKNLKPNAPETTCMKETFEKEVKFIWQGRTTTAM